MKTFKSQSIGRLNIWHVFISCLRMNDCTALHICSIRSNHIKICLTWHQSSICRSWKKEYYKWMTMIVIVNTRKGVLLCGHLLHDLAMKQRRNALSWLTLLFPIKQSQESILRAQEWRQEMNVQSSLSREFSGFLFKRPESQWREVSWDEWFASKEVLTSRLLQNQKTHYSLISSWKRSQNAPFEY